MDLEKAPRSKNFEDRTGWAKDWLDILGRNALRGQDIDPDEGLRGLPQEEMRRILFQKALEEFGTMYPNEYQPYFRKGRGPLKDPNGKASPRF